MSVASGRQRTSLAVQACIFCKTRKKKCNKLLPSCGYCIRKGAECVYAPRKHAAVIEEDSQTTPVRVRPLANIVSAGLILSARSRTDHTTEEGQGQVCLEVHRLIRATGQFVDDISARYFQGFHRHLPIISRTRFYNKLITLGSAPDADFSVLLLIICLVTHAPALGYTSRDGIPPSDNQHPFYLTTRSLFTQVQASNAPSIPLLQAGLLLAVYDYTHGRPDDAFVNIAGIARMGYAIGIYSSSRQTLMTGPNDPAGCNADINVLLQSEEAANTWWGIVICERTFLSEASLVDQPLLTVCPGGDARLPTEPQVVDQLDVSGPESLINIPVSCLTSPKIGGFGRTAQATCLLDQVLRSFKAEHIDSKLLQLDRLDANIQAFLSLVMPQCQGQRGIFCTSINIAIRALFMLHWHIIDQNSQTVSANFKSLEEWHKTSQEALDTVTRMVVDIAESLVTVAPANSEAPSVDAMPPTYQYIVQSALNHIRNRPQGREIEWTRGAEDVLQTSLHKYFQRWSVHND